MSRLAACTLALLALGSTSGCGPLSPRGSTEPAEVSEPIDADDAAEPEPAPAATVRVERHSGYGRDWDDAYEVVLAERLRAFARLGVKRVELLPHEVEGRRYRHIVRSRLHHESGASESILVVAHNELIDRSAGPEGLTAYLAGIGFPRVQPPVRLLVELVCYFEVAVDDGSPWCASVGEEPAAGARIEIHRDGAVLYLRPAPLPVESDEDDEADDEPVEETHRFELHFDAEAGVRVDSFRQRRNGRWEPLADGDPAGSH